MDIYQTEDEQVEALKKWWQENGKSAIFGVAVGLVAIFGWREYKDYSLEQTENASEVYQQMVIALRDDKSADIEQAANNISANYDSTAYASFAALGLAKIAISENDLAGAEEHLQTALKSTSHKSLKQIISLRLVRVYIAQNELKKASAIISKNSGDNAFSVSFQELQGDIYQLEGDFENARKTYQAALDKASESEQDTALLDLKLDDLGRAEG